MREPGYYWVKYDNEWTVGHFDCSNNRQWLLTMSDVDFQDSEFEEIDECRIMRNVSMVQEEENRMSRRYISDNPYTCDSPDL